MRLLFFWFAGYSNFIISQIFSGLFGVFTKTCNNLLKNMSRTKLDKRFFASTRGRIVALLRGTTRTVDELAEELELTDNAVRAHLLSLERDGLLRQSGLQRGTRKPHFAYELT